MKYKDVRKVHKFVNGDPSHVNSKAKLDEITIRIKACGHTTEANLVHDTGEEDKENVLNHHNEKLPVTYV